MLDRKGCTSQKLALHLTVLGGYGLLTVVLTYPVALRLISHIPIAHQIPGWVPGDGDPWYFLWAVWFAHHSLFELGQLPIWTNEVFYPRGVDLSFFVTMAFPVILGVLAVQLFGPILTYNIFFLSSFVFAGYAAFLLINYLTRDRSAAFLGGIIYAFAPYHLVHGLEHITLLMSAPWPPACVLFLIKTQQEASLANPTLAALFFALTLITHPYYSVFLLLFTVIYWVDAAYAHPSQFIARPFLQRAFLLVSVASILATPLIWMVRRSQDVAFYLPLEHANHYAADLLAFFLPARGHPVAGRLVSSFYERFSGNEFEQTVYMGYTVLGLSLVALFKSPGRQVRVWIVATFIFFILSLGPLLHINGQTVFDLDGLKIGFPLPYLIIHYLPLIGGVRVPSRFAVMVLLSLAVLAGYGAKVLNSRIGKEIHETRRRFGVLFILAMFILFEFLMLPFPVLEARVPEIYRRIAQAHQGQSSLLEVPLDWKIVKYGYYQTAHRRRLIISPAQRLALPLLTQYADSFPFIRLFKQPESIVEYEQHTPARRDVLRFIEFFDLSFIILHKDYMSLEVFERLMRYLLAYFPVISVEEEYHIVALQLAGSRGNTDLWAEEGGYILDFGSPAPQFFLTEGWSSAERWGELTGAWSDAKMSRLWVFFPRPEDFMMELRLLPLMFPASPPQGIKVYVNERFLSELQLEAASDWRSYALRLPRTYLRAGINTFRFVYRYTASPSKIVPGNKDFRTLAVAFDFLVFRPE